jgi:hypothetical protein
MATQTLATADALLKDVYRGPIIEQLNYKTYMLDQIQRDSDSVDFTGRRAIFPVHSAPNFSPTSIVDGGTLPTPGTQGYLDGIVNIRYHAGGMALTDQTIKQATGNEGAFVNVLDNDAKKLAQDMKKNINRQVFGTGNGVITTLTSSPAAGTTFTVASTQYMSRRHDDRHRHRRERHRPGGGGHDHRDQPHDEDDHGRHERHRHDRHGRRHPPGAWGNEMDGLQNITGTGRTLHGINSATAGNEFWNGNRVAASGATAGEGLFEQLIDTIGSVGQGEVDVILTSRGVRRRLADTYQSTKRFTNAQAVQIHGGYTAIFVNEVPVIADDDVPKGWAFAIRKDAFKWFQLQDPDWLKSEDGTVFQLAAGSVAGTHKAAWRRTSSGTRRSARPRRTRSARSRTPLTTPRRPVGLKRPDKDEAWAGAD